MLLSHRGSKSAKVGSATLNIVLVVFLVLGRIHISTENPSLFKVSFSFDTFSWLM